MGPAVVLEHGDLAGAGTAFSFSLREFEKIGLHRVPGDGAGGDGLRKIAAAFHVVAAVDEDRAAHKGCIIRLPKRGR